MPAHMSAGARRHCGTRNGDGSGGGRGREGHAIRNPSGAAESRADIAADWMGHGVSENAAGIPDARGPSRAEQRPTHVWGDIDGGQPRLERAPEAKPVGGAEERHGEVGEAAQIPVSVQAAIWGQSQPGVYNASESQLGVVER